VNTLVLRPSHHGLTYTLFGSVDGRPLIDTCVNKHVTLNSDAAEMSDGLQKLARDVRAAGRPDLVALRVRFGGAFFTGPTRVGLQTLALLESLVPQAPLHLPGTIRLITGCGDAFADVPVILLFETAFFTDLPRRECLYGIDPGLSDALSIRRFGYHGLFHEAACTQIISEQRRQGNTTPPRTISICLEPKPEIAAARGRRPVMVTSGATPLEGLPGHTTCGEIDPSIVLILAEQLKWGPERINAVLTRESGLRGLTGPALTFETLFANRAKLTIPTTAGDPADNDDAATELARQIVCYRLMNACGAALAALSGLDAIVFSGRYARLGEILGPYLVERLTFPGARRIGTIVWQCARKSLDRIMAETSQTALLEQGVGDVDVA
jgi:acetate kinase